MWNITTAILVYFTLIFCEFAIGNMSMPITKLKFLFPLIGQRFFGFILTLNSFPEIAPTVTIKDQGSPRFQVGPFIAIILKWEESTKLIITRLTYLIFLNQNTRLYETYERTYPLISVETWKKNKRWWFPTMTINGWRGTGVSLINVFYKLFPWDISFPQSINFRLSKPIL